MAVGYWGLQVVGFQYHKSLLDEDVSQYYIEFGGLMNDSKWHLIDEKEGLVEQEWQTYYHLRQKLFQNTLEDTERAQYETLQAQTPKREAWDHFYQEVNEKKKMGLSSLDDPLNTDVFLLLKADRLRLMRVVLQSLLYSLLVFISLYSYMNPQGAHIYKATRHGKKDMWLFIMCFVVISALVFELLPWVERFISMRQVGLLDLNSSVHGSLSLKQVLIGQVMLQLSFLLSMAGFLLLSMSYLKPLATLIALLICHFVLALTSSLPIHPMGVDYHWIKEPLGFWLSLGMNCIIFLFASYKSYRRNFRPFKN